VVLVSKMVSDTEDDDRKKNGATVNAEVTAVSSNFNFQLPSFNAFNVKLWLSQVNSCLKLYNLKSEARKFSYVSSSLPVDVADKLSYLIVDPFEEEPYKKLCEAIKKEFAVTDNARITKLLEQCELSDMKPTQLLRKMRELAQKQVDDAFFFQFICKKASCSSSRSYSRHKDKCS